MAAKKPPRTRRNSGKARTAKEIRPGTTIGRQSAADDGIAQNQLRRGQVSREAERGRHQPSGNPRGLSQKRRSTGSSPGG